MKNLLILFTLILINIAAFGSPTDSLRFLDRYGREHTIAKDGYMNHASCVIQKDHVCIDNSCHHENCGCPECQDDDTKVVFGWIMGILFGFMIIVLFFFALQNNMFSTKIL